MTNWLLRTFVRNSEDLENSKVRAAVGQLAGIVGILCNILLFSGKLPWAFSQAPYPSPPTP